MIPAAANMARRWTIALASGFGVVTALFAYVVVRWPDNFFADDSYFYFQVAWNIAKGRGSTFNNVIPTNGYHPLWMLVCVLIFKILPARAAAVHGIGAAIAAIDAGALFLLGRVMVRTAPQMWWTAFVLYMPFCFLSQLGTEGALSGFFLAALVFATIDFCTNPDGKRGFLFALCGALAVLSRLDNIFIVSFIFLAVFIAAPEASRSRVRRILSYCIPVYVVLWGAYVESNVFWFGTIQPISGMLKAHPHGESSHFTSPPHVAQLGLAIIILCVPILARFRRDTFFKVVELPFAIGVMFHAAYILLVMSNETRWTWYYTSWILLSSILLSRVLSLLLSGRPDFVANSLATTAVVCLFVVWMRVSVNKFAHYDAAADGATYKQNLDRRLNFHTVLAFDKPGRMAYYTDVQVIALDGLMGDLKFQQDLANEGIAAFDAKIHADGFVGPPMPLDANEKAQFCDQIFLSAVRFHCVPEGPGKWTVDSVEVFARLTGTSAGSLPLAGNALAWNEPGVVAVWRLPEVTLPETLSTGTVKP